MARPNLQTASELQQPNCSTQDCQEHHECCHSKYLDALPEALLIHRTQFLLWLINAQLNGYRTDVPDKLHNLASRQSCNESNVALPFYASFNSNMSHESETAAIGTCSTQHHGHLQQLWQNVEQYIRPGLQVDTFPASRKHLHLNGPIIMEHDYAGGPHGTQQHFRL